MEEGRKLKKEEGKLKKEESRKKIEKRKMKKEEARKKIEEMKLCKKHLYGVYNLLFYGVWYLVERSHCTIDFFH